MDCLAEKSALDCTVIVEAAFQLRFLRPAALLASLLPAAPLSGDAAALRFVWIAVDGGWPTGRE